MQIVCLDLEGVLMPEIWRALAHDTGIEELTRTTRDEPDYNILMRQRLKILREHHVSIQDIHRTIAAMEPLDGAALFLESLRRERQIIILSDTFYSFINPFMKKLASPTIFCNDLIIDSQGVIQDYELRKENAKADAVAALQSMNFTVFAAGDSYNDITMIQQADMACFFRAPESILTEYSTIPAFTDYENLLNYICGD